MFISKNIDYLKRKKGLSYRDLELLSGIGHSVIYYIVIGRIKDPSISKVANISKALNVTLDEMVYKDLEKENIPAAEAKSNFQFVGEIKTCNIEKKKNIRKNEIIHDGNKDNVKFIDPEVLGESLYKD